MMSKISKYFTLEEMNCKCKNCKNKKPPILVMNNLLLLGKELDKLREKVGKPMIVDSAYRCPTHNKEVGGVDNSTHTKGLACDWHVFNMTEEDMFRYASLLEPEQAGVKKPKWIFSGVGYYPNRNFCHVDISKSSKRPATWKG